jgi:RNA polymerase sigma-70 factor (ECF subfamily)
MNKTGARDVNTTDALEKVDSLSDEWLMDAHVEGNETCFGILIKRYERELYSYLRRLLIDPVLAEDVFQNTFLQVHVKRHLYEQGRPFRPWLYKIATHQAIDAMRRNRRHQQASLNTDHDNAGNGSTGALMDMLECETPSPQMCAERNERRHLVRRAVDNLAEHLRAVIVLSYYQGMKYKEIADILQIPVGTVKSRLHAAINRLGDEWERLGFTQDS